MRVLVTGSSGHLGEALVRVLTSEGHEVLGLDLSPSSFTDVVGSAADRSLVSDCMNGADAVIHAASLHKPHVGTHGQQDFIDANLMGTLCMLEQAVAAKVGSFVFTSTTSVFGSALTPPEGAPAVWVTEDVAPVPRNIYGVTKRAAEDLVEIFHHDHDLPCMVLRTSRFFPELDDNPAVRDTYDDTNVKVNELLYRRVDLEDVVGAHLLAMHRAPSIGFGRYIVSATTPFSPEDVVALRDDAAAVVRRKIPECGATYDRLGWRLFPSIDRVYDNERARDALGWEPRCDFRRALASLDAKEDPRSELSIAVGAKGYRANSVYPYTRPSPATAAHLSADVSGYIL